MLSGFDKNWIKTLTHKENEVVIQEIKIKPADGAIKTKKI